MLLSVNSCGASQILKVNFLFRPLTLISVGLLLTACQSTGPQVSESESSSNTRPPPPLTIVPERQAPQHHTAAAQVLLDEAQQLQGRQQWQQAIEVAERGLRIDRRMAEFYLVLAQSYEAMGERSSAQSFARQGARYAPVGGRVYKQLRVLLP